jgi:Na+/melibiose symporter-like transporter
MLRERLKIPAGEYRVFRLHILFSIIQGVIMGVFALNEFVFIKDMQGTKYQLSVLLQLSVILMLFSVFVNEFLRRIRNKRKMLIWAAVITHTPLLALAFFPDNTAGYETFPYYHIIFLAIFFMFFLNLIIVLPIINQMLKAAYSHENFGRLYSYSSSINKTVLMVVTFGFGLLLDVDNFAFIYVYPALAVLGVFSVYLLAKIDVPQEDVVIKRGFLEASLQSLRRMKEILRNNRPYRHFEIGFMFYGFAWMITAAIIAIYFNEALHMNHATYGFYKNGYNLMAIVLLPYFGKMLGKIDPRKFAAITFASLLFYLLFLALAEHFPYSFQIGSVEIFAMLIMAYLFYGIFAATMALLWFIGSAYFCKKEEAALYQSVHLSLTGLRALVSFQIGIVFYQLWGFTTTFAIAIGSLAIAVGYMVWSYQTDKMTIAEVRTEAQK